MWFRQSNKLSISDERKSVSSSDSAFTEEDGALLTAFCDQIRRNKL